MKQLDSLSAGESSSIGLRVFQSTYKQSTRLPQPAQLVEVFRIERKFLSNPHSTQPTESLLNKQSRRFGSENSTKNWQRQSNSFLSLYRDSKKQTHTHTHQQLPQVLTTVYSWWLNQSTHLKNMLKSKNGFIVHLTLNFSG